MRILRTWISDEDSGGGGEDTDKALHGPASIKALRHPEAKAGPGPISKPVSVCRRGMRNLQGENVAMTGERKHRVQDPFFWLKQAKELDRAAMLIWAGIEADLQGMSKLPVGTTVVQEQFRNGNLGGVFWLNAGLALENVLKGLIVKEQPDVVINGRLKRDLKTHKLLKLSGLAGANLSTIEAFYLSIATECVTWAGRYPSSATGTEPKPSVFSEGDVLAYRKLFDRLAGQLDAGDGRVVTFQRLA